MSAVQRFKRAPEEVEAVQWTGTNEFNLQSFCGSDWDPMPGDHSSPELWESDNSRWRIMYSGDWVVKDADGNFVRIAEEDFWKMFEAIP